MITLASLWLPILLSAVFVFIASSLLHTVLPWHKGDFKKVPQEDAAMDALRPFAIPPGDYMIPCCEDREEMKSGATKAKLERGPVVICTVLPTGNISMGKSLVLWFAFLVVVMTVAAYLATKTIPATASYHKVFGVVGVACFLGFAGALWQESIWYSRSWRTTFKSTIDGALYAALAAGTFGWLWPR